MPGDILIGTSALAVISTLFTALAATITILFRSLITSKDELAMAKERHIEDMNLAHSNQINVYEQRVESLLRANETSAEKLVGLLTSVVNANKDANNRVADTLQTLTAAIRSADDRASREHQELFHALKERPPQ